MMIPLRRALIVKEHGTLAYPEGTACAQVLIAGEKGGALARTAYGGLACAFAYAILQKVAGVIAESPEWVSSAKSRVFPAATVAGDITPEYMGIGYILGVRNAGLLCAGGVLAWLGIIPLLASLVPGASIATQLVKLGYAPGHYGYDEATQSFTQLNLAIYFAYARQIGAGAVAAGGFMTLIKTIPTIVSAFKGSLASMVGGDGDAAGQKRTERDLPLTFVLGGSVALVAIIAVLPFLPGTVLGKALLGVMMVVFGFFFVTVSSRIVGIIGTSSNPISGMTIATLMATCLLFVAMGWTGDVYQPMALCVGGMVCIAAANAGATSQDLKTGFLVGATPRAQQIGLMIGVVVASLAIGVTIKILDNAHVDPATGQVVHAIGSAKLSAPQGTLMATLIRGLLAHNLDWQFVLCGVFISVTMELCGVSALAFAVGAYLPLSTTLPIFVGGVVRWLADKRAGAARSAGDDELGPGNLFSTGLVAGGALAGVLYAMLAAKMGEGLESLSLQPALARALGEGGYQILGVGFFAVMGAVLFRVATRKQAAH
jgi:putative OPT family oligopeptide transporter